MILIRAAEDEAGQSEILARQKAKEAIQEAERIGKETVAATIVRAESEVAHLKRMSDQKAMKDAMELASSTANRQATLRARAERRLDAVAEHIVERIVNTPRASNKAQKANEEAANETEE
jgi:hypothetical protein